MLRSVPRFCLPLALSALLLATSTSAQTVNATNLTPFTGVLGQPALRSARLPGRGHLEWQADVALASHSAIGAGNGEFVFIDGETLRLAASARYQPAERWQISIEVPWFSHRGGFLDTFIEQWHDLTGLTNGERDRQDRDRLRYSYAGPADTFELARDGDGLGDIRLDAVFSLHQGPKRQAAVRALIELPTGDVQRLTGNGATDVAIDLLVSGDTLLRERAFYWYYQAGILFPGDGEVLASLQREAIVFGGLGAGWQWRPRINLFAQAALSGDPWRSELAELGAASIELTAGLSWPAGQGQWAFGFSEDLAVDRSPDIVLRLAWRSQGRAP